MPELKSEIRDTLESNPELHFTSSTLQDKFEARDVQVRGVINKHSIGPFNQNDFKFPF